MARCLVTGGAGFIGAHLVRALLDQAHEVTVFDDLSGGRIQNVDARARFVEGSVADHYAVEALFASEPFEVVYHLAAYAAEGLSQFIKRYNYTNNLTGSVNLINAAVNSSCACFVFTSSIAVYGSRQTPMAESLVPAPEDSYGIAKHAVELELEVTRRKFGLDYVIFRPHNVYGELQNIGDRYRNVIGFFMNQIMSGVPMSIFGNGCQTRAFTYIGDIVAPIASAPWTDGAIGETFNIGAQEGCSLNDLADIVRTAMERPDHPIVHYEARDEVRHAVSDHAKATYVFGASPRTPVEAGVARMAAWARERGAQTTRPFTAIEIVRDLPATWTD